MNYENRQIREELDQVIEELEKRNVKHNDDYDIVGVGDVVEQVLTKFGITQERFRAFFKLQECDCNKRKEWLNGIFYWRSKKK